MTLPYHVLVLPDMHVPYHAGDVLLSVLDYARDTVFHECVILGDFMDFDCISSYVKDKPRAIEGKTLQADYAVGNMVLDAIQDAITAKNPDCRLVMLEGNHEFRIERLLDSQPQLQGLLEVPRNLNLEKRGIKWVPCYTDGEIYSLGKANFHHGLYCNKYHARTMAENFGVNIFYGHCFDEQTELLTPDGWRSRAQLEVGDRVMTMNKATGALEPEAIQAVFDYPAEDYPELVEIKGRNVDLLVTDRHGLVDRRPNGSLELYEAKDFGKRTTRTFICAAEEDRVGLALTEDQIRLAVWIAADGSFANPGYATPAVRFKLKKPRKVARLGDLLTRMGLPYTSGTQESGVQWLYTNLSDYLIEHPEFSSLFDWVTRQLPAEFAALNCAQARVLLDEYSHTDGCRTGPTSVQISTSKPEEADLLQQLFVTSGLRCNLSQRTGGAYTLAVNEAHVFSELRPENNIRTVPNPGTDVWCVTVPNGTLVARRNGKVCVTQNTHSVQTHAVQRMGKHTTIVGQSFGCLCTYDLDYIKRMPTNWQHAFGDFWFWPDGFFQYHVTQIYQGQFFAPNGRAYGHQVSER